MLVESAIESFQRDGAICLRQLFTPAEIGLLRTGIESNLAGLSPRAIVASAAGDPGRFIEDFCNWQDNPSYRRFIFESALAETAGKLMRSRSARLYHDHMLTRVSVGGYPAPW